MALITCRECGKEISDSAYTCPQCGAPQKSANKIAKTHNNGMTKAMLILGIIGSIIAFGGAIGTVISGFASASMGALADQGASGVLQDGVNIENEAFADGAFIFWSGALSLIVAAIALISSITGGVAKRKNIIFVFAISVLISGLINIYLYNWFSGAIIAISGLLGIIGSRSGTTDEKALKQEVIAYIMFVIIASILIASIAVKNGSEIITETTDDANISVNTTADQAIPIAPQPTEQQTDSAPIQNTPSTHTKYDNMECHSAWTLLNDSCKNLAPENCENPVADPNMPMVANGYLEDVAFASECAEICYGKINFDSYADFEKRICN